MKITLLSITTLLLAGSAGALTTPKTANAGRRGFLISGAAAVVATTAAAAPASAAFRLGDPNSVVGREIQSFNGLIYNFKNTALDGGLDASKIKGDSIPFIEFGEKMKNGEVAFVEFMAPNGEVAYATFKDKNGKKEAPIRIGQGYPTGGKGSWSSPDFVIRSVSNFGVPYTFTVPGLKKYS
mmetsp:Transcript_9714/g.16161  ORF Transcript_9714/g.16161 Transcript_9714/m.16161 type:complete len:182 (-) Transcript_9714:213-758(-)